MPSATRVRLQMGGQWIDITADTKAEEMITITRGRRSRASGVETSLARLKLRDDGRFSWTNPRSLYHGMLVPNCPIRIDRVGDGYVKLTGVETGNYAQTPDHSSLDITGDLDVRADVDLDYERSVGGVGVASKYNITGNQRSWALWIDQGVIVLRWSPNGSTLVEARSTAALPLPAVRVRLRATLDVDNGAGGRTVTFYTAQSIAGPWTQLGAPVTAAGTTALFASTAALLAGDIPSINLHHDHGKIHAVQVRNGIGGTIVANLDLAAATPNTTSVTDSAGRLWTAAAGARFDTGDIRFAGLLKRLPTGHGVSGRARWANVTASGLLADLEDDKAPLASPIFREATSETNLPHLVGYWPAQDGTLATSLASGIGGPAMQIKGEISLASREDILGSEPLPELQTGTILTATIPTYTPNATAVIAFRGVFALPPGGWPDAARIVEIHQASGTVRRWLLRNSTAGGGALILSCYDSTDTLLQETAALVFPGLNGSKGMIGFQVSQSGSDVYWQIFYRKVNADLTVTELGGDGTFNSLQVTRATRIAVAAGGTLPFGVAGHFMVGKSADLAAGLTDAIVGNATEPAGRRIQRLCRELGIALRTVGDLDDTTPAGPQRPGRAIELLRTAEGVDQGVLGEARDELALLYRTRASLYNQKARLTLSYGEPGESPHLATDPDAADIINDVTVTNHSGSSARAVLEAGPLSVQRPGAGGVGRKPEDFPVDVASDAQLPDEASWRLHQNTWAEDRYPKIPIELDKLIENGKPELATAAARLDLLDRLVIADLPDWMPPDPIDQVAEGMTEVIGPRSWDLDLACSPARPFDVGEWDDPSSLYDSGSTTLAEDIDLTETSWDISTADVGDVWSTADGPFNWTPGPADTAGEVVTVTAVSAPTGTGPYLQTATVVRAVNGITKTHAAGTEIHLTKSGRWAL